MKKLQLFALAIILSFASSNILQAGKKKKSGAICRKDKQCKSGYCVHGTCRSKCAGIGAACNSDNDCCKKNCISGTCRDCQGESYGTNTKSELDNTGGKCCPGLTKQTDGYGSRCVKK